MASSDITSRCLGPLKGITRRDYWQGPPRVNRPSVMFRGMPSPELKSFFFPGTHHQTLKIKLNRHFALSPQAAFNVVPPENPGVRCVSPTLPLLRNSQSCHVENLTCRLHDSSHEKEGPREGNIPGEGRDSMSLIFPLSLF
jgi:hypothetical protein